MTTLRVSLSLGVLLGAVACAGSSDDSGGSGGSPNAGRGGAAGAGASGGSGGTAGGSGGTAGTSTGGSGGSAVTGGSGGASGGNAGSATTGGSGGAGGASGGSTGGGASGAGGGGRAGSGGSGTAGSGVCCNAIPTCGPGEREVPTAQDCANIPMCHAVSLCCTTIYCSVLTPGSGGSSGAGGAGGSGSCDPETEPDRDYVGESREACMLIRFECPEHTAMFANDCGCGCEQDASCPDFVDCMPGGNPDPGCSPEERERCPYTVVAF